MVLFALAGILALCAPATAAPLHLDGSVCHAVTARQQADDILPRLRFDCTGTPSGYQRASLWLRTEVPASIGDRRDLVLMIHQSRFDRLAVVFTYADGAQDRQQVRGGDFGVHWRSGGQIAFEAPIRQAPVVAVTLRFDGLASHHLLRARLLPRGESSMESATLGVAIGAALTLLLIGAAYNASLAIALRRGYLAWHGAWAGCMFVWGLIWSQIHLLVVPGMAGTVSAQICTLLACLAVTFATTSIATALDRAVLPRHARTVLLVLAGAMGLFGVPLALIRSAAIESLAGVASILILANLLAVVFCLAWAWRRGSAEARDFTWAWSLPMATLAAIQFVDVDGAFWGGGSKLLILFAASWQTLWLAMAATRRFGRLRVERDSARAAEARANELARRDPLTGLRNRRGFVDAIDTLMAQAELEGGVGAFLLIDIDSFKSVNDAHGHEAGDMVLRTIARRLERWEGPMCAVGRLGGEEFALMIVGIEDFALARFADSVRLEIAACDHSEAVGGRMVTASIGVAVSRGAIDFQNLYRLADQALYTAKQDGRNRVVQRLVPVPTPPSPASAPAVLRARK